MSITYEAKACDGLDEPVLAAMHSVSKSIVRRICSSVWLAVMKNRMRTAASGTAG